MNEKKIKESKKQIQGLAELCINEIYENKFLEEKKEIYNEHLTFIKKILLNKFDSSIIKQEIKKLHESLIISNSSLKKEKQNLNNKLLSYKDNISKEGTFSDKQKLINAKSDNLLLLYQIKEKNDIIDRLNKAIESIKVNKYFKESKRELIINNNKWGHYYITANLNDLSKNLMSECENFIQYNNKCFKKEKEKTQTKNKKNYLNDVIDYFRKELGKNFKKEEKDKKIKNSNKNNKKALIQTMILKNEKELSLFDVKDDFLNDNLLIDEEIKNKEINLNNTTQYIKDIPINKSINNSIKKKKKANKNSKFDFLTVDELFDMNNLEGKKEAIIDEELHSDDDTKFETKIKPLKKIGIHYIPKIRKQVPSINLSQIEYNKQKVMNEADLYSLQRRKFKNQNVDENIKNMKKKVKKYKYKCKLNKKKMHVFENYAKNIENHYKELKHLKVQSSLGGVKIPKIQNFFIKGFNDKNNNAFDDIDLSNDDSDNLEDDELDNNNYNETFNSNKMTFSDKNNIQIYNLNNKKIKLRESDKKFREDINKLNRANSK